MIISLSSETSVLDVCLHFVRDTTETQHLAMQLYFEIVNIYS